MTRAHSAAPKASPCEASERAETALASMADAADAAEASDRPKLAARMREVRGRFRRVVDAGLREAGER